jgi:hypothetical protein
VAALTGGDGGVEVIEASFGARARDRRHEIEKSVHAMRDNIVDLNPGYSIGTGPNAQKLMQRSCSCCCCAGADGFRCGYDNKDYGSGSGDDDVTCNDGENMVENMLPMMGLAES